MATINLGETNRLRVSQSTDSTLYMDAGEAGELRLPRRQADEDLATGDWINVFVYLDSDDRPAVTTVTPRAQVGQCACLRVAQVNQVGAFLDWGLPKELLVPYAEQKYPMEQAESHIVCVYIDDRTGRIVASSKLDRFLSSINDDFEVGLPVELMVHSLTDLGYKCVVDHTHWGVLYYGDVFERLSRGDTKNGYIKRIREDGKIDLCLQPLGVEGTEDVSHRILAKLGEHEGFLAVNDKSAPQDVYALLGVSKKAFKKALGSLYKKRLVTLEDDGVRLVDTPGDSE